MPLPNGQCEDCKKCANAGLECENCTRRFDYAEQFDWFQELEVDCPCEDAKTQEDCEDCQDLPHGFLKTLEAKQSEAKP